MQLSAPNANSCELPSSQSAAAGFLFPPTEIKSEDTFILASLRYGVVALQLVITQGFLDR
jgi:hypothetical protein